MYEIRDGTPHTYYYADGERIAEMYYYTNDHLSGTSIITDEDGNVVNSTEYYPYGSPLKEQGSKESPYKFTGKEYSKATGLYYYGARWYDPQLGSFITPDSIVPDCANPQSLNRYSYVYNSPLNYVDPTGNFLIGISFHFFVGGHIGYNSDTGSWNGGGDVGMGGGASFSEGIFSIGSSTGASLDYGYDSGRGTYMAKGI